MAYCPKCGVELDNNIRNCPLCSFPIPYIGDSESEELPRDSRLLNRYNMKQLERRRRFNDAKPFVFAGILIVLIIISITFGFIDFYFYGGLTWSRYVIAANLLTAVVLFFSSGIIQSFSICFLGISLTALGFLYSIDSFDGSISWFLSPGLIICFNVIIWTLILRRIIIHSRRRGLNIPAYWMFALSFACVSIDVIQNFSVNHVVNISWSFTVLITLMPLGIILILLNLIISPSGKKKVKKIFHF
ncbi:MAG: hypothetical protein PQJ46_13340 [Spirochaetales bacterium]|nr:hypothetical protein [Spirochaetales bacterium]